MVNSLYRATSGLPGTSPALFTITTQVASTSGPNPENIGANVSWQVGAGTYWLTWEAPTTSTLNGGLFSAQTGGDGQAYFHGDGWSPPWHPAYNVSIDGSTTAPTVSELVDLSKDVYEHANSAVDGYAPIINKSFDDGLTVNVYRNADNQYVEAIRGTEPEPDKNAGFQGLIDNFKADLAFVDTANVAQLKAYVSEAVDVLKSIPDVVGGAVDAASITLTGHSLGGALAQILGNGTGLKAVAFDAPGAPQQIQDAMAGLFGGAPSGPGGLGTNLNYRLFGDAVSLQNAPTGQIITIGNPTSFPEGNDVTHNWVAAFDSHNIDILAAALKDPTVPQEAGAFGPDSRFSLLEGVGFSAALAGGNALVGEIRASMTAFELRTFDPQGYSDFTFQSDLGSPFLHTLILPKLSGIDRYRLRTFGLFGTSGWVDLIAGEPFDFGDSVTGFEFSAEDQGGNSVLMPQGFLFQLSTSTSGELEATLRESFGGVPEPSSWLLFTLGIGGIGAASRRAKKSAVVWT